MIRTVLRAGLCSLTLLLHAQGTPGAQASADLEAAVAQVKEIVNQPVTRVAMTSPDQAALFQPGWFHPGAIVPDFDHVDVRASQDCPYGKWPYVTSDVTPGFMFPGPELSFNAMTKWFYTDRTLPKKKLSEQELLQINDLYRTIGKSLRTLRELQAKGGAAAASVPDAAALGPMAPLVAPAPAGTADAPAAAVDQDWLSPQRLEAAGAVLILALAWMWVRARRS
jgi:hypothetical protein